MAKAEDEAEVKVMACSACKITFDFAPPLNAQTNDEGLVVPVCPWCKGTTALTEVV